MPPTPLKIGMIAPPWLPVPPVAYGGTELMVDALCRALERAGHEVTLFTIGSSSCPVPRRWLFEEMDPDRMGAAVEELRHALAAYESLLGVDIVHDHTLAGLFLGPRRSGVPIVTTMHGPFDHDLSDLYGRIAATVPIVAISRDQARRAPPGLPVARVIHHGLELTRYPYSERPDDQVLFLGRMSPDKGVETAIEVARRAGRRLVIAAKMREPCEIQYFREVIEPMLGAGAEYVGEADFATKVELLGKSAALLNPIRWPEPFGLVMIESLACGTPVVGGSHGAAGEIVRAGRTGWLADGTDGLVRGLEHLGELDRADCRREVVDHFTSDRMAADYVDLYREVLAEKRRPDLRGAVRPAVTWDVRPMHGEGRRALSS
ncbi:MAG: glycosyltransferase family 4 protein [Actinomycetota bacterium]